MAVKLVHDISAFGLRHADYEIPMEFFGPLVSTCVGVVMKTGFDEHAVESFQWSWASLRRYWDGRPR